MYQRENMRHRWILEWLFRERLWQPREYSATTTVATASGRQSWPQMSMIDRPWSANSYPHLMRYSGHSSNDNCRVCYVQSLQPMTTGISYNNRGSMNQRISKRKTHSHRTNRPKTERKRRFWDYSVRTSDWSKLHADYLCSANTLLNWTIPYTNVWSFFRDPSDVTKRGAYSFPNRCRPHNLETVVNS